jgi:signal transduction histidine kinase/CheY-like chemotaxis protein
MDEPEVRLERIRTLYRHGPAVLVTSVVNAAIVCGLFWGSVPQALLAGFVLAVLLLSAARFALHRSFWRAAPTATEAVVWARRFTGASFASGAVWGTASFLLYELAGERSQLILPFVVGGMIAAGAGTTAIHLPAFVAFAGPALLGFVARAFAIGDGLHLAMGTMLVVFGAGITAVASVNQRSLTKAFRLRFENQALLEELSRARAHLEETNRTLERRVDERTRALEAQAEALRDAQRLEMVGRLAGGVAHDFNNLLTAVHANASELLERAHGKPALSAPLREVRHAAERGSELVKQLLAFGRKQRGPSETFDLRRSVRELEGLFRRLLGANIELSSELGETPLYVHADPGQIELLITNLVTNARDAIEGNGSVHVRAERTTRSEAADGLPPGAYVVLSVRDTGVGMDSETRRHVFEPFFTTKDVGKGSGLGLAAAHGIVAQNGGKIVLDSEPERGSCFRVYLPEHPAPPPEIRASEPSGAAATPTILLVEDDSSVRTVTERMLKRNGYQILSAENAEHGLELARDHSGSIDLLVTDVVMPGLSGPELARRLRSLRPGISTLFISGYARDHRLLEADERHAVSFLPKPFTREDFDAEVRKLVLRTAIDR